MGSILTLLVLGATVFELATSQNALITNGTCYYYDGKQADDVYTPCGNAAFGHLSCCQLGDACYQLNACVTVGKRAEIGGDEAFVDSRSRQRLFVYVPSWLHGYQLRR